MYSVSCDINIRRRLQYKLGWTRNNAPPESETWPNIDSHLKTLCLNSSYENVRRYQQILVLIMIIIAIHNCQCEIVRVAKLSGKIMCQNSTGINFTDESQARFILHYFRPWNWQFRENSRVIETVRDRNEFQTSRMNFDVFWKIRLTHFGVCGLS